MKRNHSLRVAEMKIMESEQQNFRDYRPAETRLTGQNGDLGVLDEMVKGRL